MRSLSYYFLIALAVIGYFGIRRALSRSRQTSASNHLVQVHSLPLVFETQEISFGKIVRNDGADRVLLVCAKNATQGDLVIDRIIAGCGCVSARQLGPYRLKPGERTTVELTLRMHDIHAGSQKYEVTLFGGAGPAVGKCFVNYEYEPRVATESPDISLGQQVHGSRVLTTVDLHTAKNVIPDDLHLRSSAQGIEFRLTRPTEDSSLRLAIELLPSRPVGYIDEKVAIFSDAIDPDLVLNVSGEVVPPISITPARLLVVGNRTRTLSINSASKFHVAKISAPGGVSIEPLSAADSTTQEYTVRFPTDTFRDKEVISGAITFDLDAPTKFSISVPFTAAVDSN